MADQTNVISAGRDVLVSEVPARDIAADAIGVSREILTGSRIGLDLVMEAVPAISREVLTSARAALDLHPIDTVAVVREVLMWEPPTKAFGVVREVLISSDEGTAPGRVLPMLKQSVVMLRPTMALPGTVKSPQIVATMRELTVQRALRPWSMSERFAATLHTGVVLHRQVPPARLVFSQLRMYTAVQQVVRSRGKAYVPVSELRIAQQRELAVQRRNFTPAGQVRTPITIGVFVQQFIASRAEQVVVITTEAHVGQHVEQVVQASGKKAPHSAIASTSLVHMTIQRHTIVPPGIDDRTAALGQQVVIGRAPTPPFGTEHVGLAREQVVQRRDYGPQRSFDIVPGYVQMAMLHRETYSPGEAVGRHAFTLAQLTAQRRTDLPVHRSITRVALLDLSFILGRTTPKPWEVIDPALGRHVAGMAMLTMQHRETLPPETISTRSRFAYNVIKHVAHGDVFPPPDYPAVTHETDVIAVHEHVVTRDNDGWAAVSAALAQHVSAALVVGDADEWIDATVPQSAAEAFGLVQSLAVGDGDFADPALPRSPAEVAALVETVALGDGTMPDPAIPISDVQVDMAIEFAALGDAQFPDPLIPLSEVRSSLVGSILALGDPSLQGNFGMSEIQAMNLGEFVVMSDRSLVGIPLRQGPRPVVSISMS